MTARRKSFAVELLGPATSRAVLSRQVVISMALISMLLHLLASPDYGTQAILVRSTAAVMSVIPMFLFVAIVQSMPVRAFRVRIALVMLSYVAGGAVRGWTLDTLLAIVAQVSGISGHFRISSSALTMSLTMLIVTWLWSTYLAHRESSIKLLEESQELQAALTQLDHETRAQTLQAMRNASVEVVHELREIHLQPADQQIAEIQRVIDDHVRPLSREMAVDVRRWLPSKLNAQSVARRVTWDQLRLLENLPKPWWNCIVGLVLAPSALHIFGLEMALLLALYVTVALVSAMWCLRQVAERWLGQLRTPWRVLLLTLGFEVVVITGASATYFVLRDTPAPSLYVPSGLIVYPVFAWIVVIGRSLWKQAFDQERELRKVHDDLQWAVARVNLMAWFNRGLITRLLHGPVQNALYASILRLRDRDPSAVVDDVIGELRKRLSAIDPRAQDGQPNAPTLLEAFEDIPRLWQGVATVDIAPTPAALLALQEDVPAGSIVLDVCNEICSNAIRHGSATRIEILIEVQTDRVVVAVSDNGEPRGTRIGVGVGTEFLDTCSIRWQATRDSAGTNRLVVEIPRMR